MLRQTETQTLGTLLRYRDSDEDAIVVFYGSPYIEHDAILSSLVRDERYFCYNASCVSDREQRVRLAACLRQKGVPLSENPGYPELMEKLVGELPVGDRLVLMFRDFENFFYEDTDFLAALVSMKKRTGRHGKLLIVLCSDAEVWVENALVDRAGALATEIDGFIKKRECTFAEIRKEFPKLSIPDAVSVYAMFGGETSLWRSYNPEKSVKANVCGLFLTEHPMGFKRLVMRRLRDLVREPAVYATILANLAAGKEKLNDLYHATGIPRAKLSVYLKTLMAPGYVEKVFSYGAGKTDQTKKGVYRIRNAFFRFYFTAIYPHESILFHTPPAMFYDRYLAAAFGQVEERVYPRICTELINRMDLNGSLPFAIADEGEWIGKAGTIDIVAEGEGGETLIGICSYRHMLTEDDYHFALQYAGQAGLRVDHCYLFSGAGFGDSLSAAARHVAGLHLMGLRELQHG